MRAVESTRQADAASMEVQLITNVEGFERITSGQGYVQLVPGYGDITWTDDLGITREVVSASGHYFELDGTWFVIDPASSLPTTVAFDPLAGLAEARNVTEVGAENVLGRSAVRFDADLDPQMGALSMGFSQEEATVFADGADASLVATIWVDTEGRIVRIVREYSASSVDGAPISATSLYLLDDFGDLRPIDVPETADAIPAPV